MGNAGGTRPRGFAEREQQRGCRGDPVTRNRHRVEGTEGFTQGRRGQQGQRGAGAAGRVKFNSESSAVMVPPNIYQTKWVPCNETEGYLGWRSGRRSE